MGDVYRLLSEPLVEDTPADGRKIDLTTPLAGVSLSTSLLVCFSRDTLRAFVIRSWTFVSSILPSVYPDLGSLNAV